MEDESSQGPAESSPRSSNRSKGQDCKYFQGGSSANQGNRIARQNVMGTRGTARAASKGVACDGRCDYGEVCRRAQRNFWGPLQRSEDLEFGCSNPVYSTQLSYYNVWHMACTDVGLLGVSRRDATPLSQRCPSLWARLSIPCCS